MICPNCGHENTRNVAFCPYCGAKTVQMEPVQRGPAVDQPVYQAEIKKVLKSGRLLVYRDRTEYVVGSTQKTVFNYVGLVSIKKEWDHIDFIREDGRKDSCPADRKCVHEAFQHIERLTRPYLDQRKTRLLSRGVRYSFPSSQGVLNDGVLDISAEQAEFKARSGKSDVVSFRDVKSAGLSTGTLDLTLFDGRTRSFAIGREMRDEVLAFVNDSIAPYLAQRKEELLSRGIYFSFRTPDGGNLNILADMAEYTAPSGQPEFISFQNVREASLYAGTLELALTDGTSRSFSVDGDAGAEVLAFVREAIEPYVTARTVGFSAAFGVDERLEINEARGVFHIVRQTGREITGEWPLEILAQCQWQEKRELNALGSVVSGSIALFRNAAKAAGNQNAAEADDRISCAGITLTMRMEQGYRTEDVWFGVFPTGMSRTNKKYERYLAEWARLSDYLRARCPACGQTGPVLPAPENRTPEIAAAAFSAAPDVPQPGNAAGAPAAAGVSAAASASAAARQDDLGIARYLEGVSRFIGSCGTPMTIAFQGNRGAGENSILKMLFNRLRGQYGDNLLWLNGRQFSQGESGEALSLLVGKKLAGLFSAEGGKENKGQAETLIVNLAGLVTGVIGSDSSIGKEMVGGLFNRGSADSSEQLVQLFSKQVETRAQNGGGKVVLFIDGLDRLPPARAVELLEAMRDFFDCRGCVFVIAADYDAVLSGARERYGQSFDESRGKRFFDELFRMSFRVPAAGYDLQGYVRSKLEHMNVRTEDEEEPELYVSLIQTSVGRDPEGIDRLFDSFQLLKNMADEETYRSRYKRLVLFALLCMQTRFRAAYDYTVQMRDNVTPEFVAGLCGQPSQFWGGDEAGEGEKAAFQDFCGVFARIIDQDRSAEISEAESRAFAEVLLISSITSR